jgi:hypothetical protein
LARGTNSRLAPDRTLAIAISIETFSSDAAEQRLKISPQSLYAGQASGADYGHSRSALCASVLMEQNDRHHSDLLLTGMAMNNAKKLINQIPTEVRDYPTAGDGLAKAAVQEKYANVETTLLAPARRAAIVQYLGSKEPQQDPPSLTIDALAYLQRGASVKESATLLPPAQHPNAWVPLRVYEYMMAFHYPVRDEPSMVNLFVKMLADSDEVVRVQAARWIKGLNLAGRMRAALQQWTRQASARKWDQYESFESIQGLLRQ